MASISEKLLSRNTVENKSATNKVSVVGAGNSLN